MTQVALKPGRDPQVPYTATSANDPLYDLAEHTLTWWRRRKTKVTSTQITNCCNAISGILQSFPA